MGNVGAGRGAVLRAEGRGARDRARRPWCGSARRALRNRAMIAHRRRRRSSRIFFFGVPFPIIIVAAGADRLFRRARPVRTLFRPAAAMAAAARSGRRRQRCSARSCRRTPAPNAARSAARRARLAASLWLAPVAVAAAAARPDNVFSQIALFFTKMAIVTFGGAYAVLAYVAQQAVEHYHWLTARRDARRARHGRDDAGPADHGDAVRRLHGAPIRDPGHAAADAGGHARRFARRPG